MKAKLTAMPIELKVELFDNPEGPDNSFPVTSTIELVSVHEQRIVLEGPLESILDDFRDELEVNLINALVAESKELRSIAKGKAAFATKALKSADEFDAVLETITENIAKEHREELKEDTNEG